MSNKETESIQLLQGTLDLIVLRTLATMGPQHAYQIATRLQLVLSEFAGATAEMGEALRVVPKAVLVGTRTTSG